MIDSVVYPHTYIIIHDIYSTTSIHVVYPHTYIIIIIHDIYSTRSMHIYSTL